MPRFHFHLRTDSRIYGDPEGTELPDAPEAHRHASTVAEELMRHSAARTSMWSMFVEDDNGQRQFDLFFADVDPRLMEFPPQTRMLAAETCRRFGALTDEICALRATLIESQMLPARAEGKPRLVYAVRS